MSEESKQERRLASMIAQVMLEVDRVQTDKEVKHIKMAYSSIDAVFDALRRPLAERQVIMLPSVTGHEQQGETVTLEVTITFIDGVTGEEMAFQWVGQGSDRGDKAVAKATTSAVRTALLKAFMLPTGDDPEQDSIQRKGGGGNSNQRRAPEKSRKPESNRRPAPTLPEVERELTKYVSQAEAEKFLLLTATNTKVASVQEIKPATLGWVMGQLEQRDKIERGAWIMEKIEAGA